ncbi:SH3 domain-containing protein, partial [Streptomyces spiralis]|uniref:SH3 domain-containing protein n=1 Tax=Streptomyces spiralis TaxID=66376 RepID=UPI0033DAF275
MRPTMSRAPHTLAALGALLASLMLPTTAEAQPAPAAHSTWAVDLTANTPDRSNTAQAGHGLTIRDRHHHPAAMPAGRSYAEYTAPRTRLGRALTALTVQTTASHPAGSQVDTEVRGQGPSGAWTQWSTAVAGRPVGFAEPVSTVQVRLVLTSPADGAAPEVSAVKLSAASEQATGAAVAAPAADPAPVTYRVYATREGLVGGTTANGHVITSHDHFVALPSRRLLASNGGQEYQVQVCHLGRCETAPVWDVGPRNTTDDYWNPSTVRESWTDLPQGMPETQAAYQNGYNNGLDQSGLRVTNPAGIDLADGTFWDGLGMTDNDWVDVTFPAGTPPPAKYWVDTFATAPVYGSPTSTTQTGTLNAGTNYVYCKVWGRQIGDATTYNHWWLKTDPDTGPANQYVSAYYLSRWGNDEAKDNNGTV